MPYHAPAQSCLTLCKPVDCNPSGSSVHGIFQARILEWVPISSSRGSFWPRDWTYVSCISCIAGGFIIAEPLGNIVTNNKKSNVCSSFNWGYLNLLDPSSQKYVVFTKWLIQLRASYIHIVVITHTHTHALIHSSFLVFLYLPLSMIKFWMSDVRMWEKISDIFSATQSGKLIAEALGNEHRFKC